MSKLQLRLSDYVSLHPKIGIKTNVEGYTLAFRINTLLGFGLQRVITKKDHFIISNQRAFIFSKYEGADTRNQAMLCLLENRGWSSEESLGARLFSSMETSMCLTKNLLKPDFILLFTEAFNSAADKQRLINSINDIKGVQSAFQLELQNLKEEENFILD